jgi:hypothetical protein
MKLVPIFLVVNTTATTPPLHPVRQQLVDQILAKTRAWKPMDPKVNPMSKIPSHLVKSSLG